MFKKFVNSFVAAACLAAILTPALPNTALAGPFSGSKSEACKGASLSASARAANNCGQDAQNDTGALIQRIVNVLTIIVGIAAVIMIIVSGLRFVTSAGDSNGITAARNGLLYALLGLLLAAFAQVIVRFVLTKAG